MRQSNLYETSKFQHQDWTPDIIRSKIVAWYDASDLSTLVIDSSSRVSDWKDKSGLGNHATQGTSTRRPYYGSFRISSNSLPCVYSPNTSAYHQLSTTSITPSSIIFVTDYNNGADATAPSSRRLINITSSSGNVALASGTANWSAIGADFASSYFKNGATSSSVTALPMPLSVTYVDRSGTLTGIYVLLGLTSTASQNWIGNLCEVLFFGTDPSASEILSLEGYLAYKWNIIDRLRPSHPYILRPPTC